MKQKQPFFSIILPTYNRPEQLATCLRSLVCLDYPRDHFEVIVVDDGSKISPKTLVDSFDKQLDITLLMQANAGPASARNTGAARAKSEFLVFLDDDCTPAPDWLLKLAARFAATPARMIGGKTLNALSDNPYATASQIIIDFVYTHYNDNPDKARFFSSNNMAIPTDQFRALGGFNVTLRTSEDRDLCERWLYHGYQMSYAPEVLIYHAHALTFRTFWRQHFNYGRGGFRFRQRLAQRDQERIKLETKLFYLNMFWYPFAQVRGFRGIWLSVLSVVSQLASMLGFFREWMNHAP
jgi:GT2 family glycosyltransferase